jgi:hypothetical protein
MGNLESVSRTRNVNLTSGRLTQQALMAGLGPFPGPGPRSTDSGTAAYPHLLNKRHHQDRWVFRIVEN